MLNLILGAARFRPTSLRVSFRQLDLTGSRRSRAHDLCEWDIAFTLSDDAPTASIDVADLATVDLDLSDLLA